MSMTTQNSMPGRQGPQGSKESGPKTVQPASQDFGRGATDANPPNLPPEYFDKSQ